MESFPSSFLSSFSLSNLPVTPPPAPPSNYPPLLRISAVRIEEKPPTTTPTSTTRTPPPQPSRSRPIPSPYPPKITPISTKQPTPPPSFATTVFNAFDDIINTFIDPPIRPSVDPKHVLAGNFVPVDELPPTECTVVSGTLPPSLHGAYIRNGPNPQFFPRGPYHLFDGDGMLHAIKISDGGATLCSRYVKTYKFTLERKTGSPVLPNFFYGFNGLAASMARGALSAVRILTGMFDPSNGIGLANTSLVFFGNKLYALADSDLPYAIKVTEDGDIVTLGRRDFDGKLFMSMTSHPKIDGETGETFAFRYGPIRPFLTFFRFDSEGRKAADVPVFSMRTPSLVHDFAITKKYAVFVDIQLDMNLMEMMFGSGSLVRANRGKIPRIGVIPRYAKDESDMRWFEVPGFNILHAINAWDEDSGDVVVMVAPNILSVEHAFERMDLIHASVEKVRIDLKTGFVSRHPVASRNLDFAVINPKYMGKKNRYIYAAIGDPLPKISGVVKLDLSMSESDRCDCTVATRIFGPGCYGGEPFYVAKEPDNPEAEEDDGYLVTYVHNENTGESSFLVMDAKSPNLDTVAAVKLPRRVPYGLHGLFVTETDLNKLKTYGQQHMA